MKAIICADKIGGHMNLLLSQLKAEGIEVECGCLPGPFSWEKRLRYYHSVLEKTEGEEIVVLIDGWDVLFQGSKDECLKRIPNDKVLVSGDMGCWPDQEKSSEYPPVSSPWRYVNAGGIAGKARLIRTLLEEGFEQAKANQSLLLDDQRFWTDLFLSKRDIIIDTSCSVFQTFYAVKDEYFSIAPERPHLYNEVTKTHPQFLHANGNNNFSAEHLRLFGMVDNSLDNTR